MSLIIARKIENAIIILGDTKLTYKDEIERKRPLYGTIKIIRQSEKVAIAFAGDNYFAHLAFQKITPNSDINVIKLILHKSHLDSGQKVDYIIASLNPNNIFEVKNGKIEKVNQSWIGSVEGFSKFQMYTQKENTITPDLTTMKVKEIPKYLTSKSSEIYSKLFDAMLDVVNDESIPEVGGFVIPLVSEGFKFKFPTYVDVFRKPLEAEEIAINATVSFGNASIGSYILNFWGGNNNCIAIHLPSPSSPPISPKLTHKFTPEKRGRSFAVCDCECLF